MNSALLSPAAMRLCFGALRLRHIHQASVCAMHQPVDRKNTVAVRCGSHHWRKSNLEQLGTRDFRYDQKMDPKSR